MELIFLPLKFTLSSMEDVSVVTISSESQNLDKLVPAYSLPPVVSTPSFSVHFHLFFTRATLS